MQSHVLSLTELILKSQKISERVILLQELKQDIGFSIKELRDAGFSAAHLREIGCTTGELKDVFSCTDLASANFSLAQLKAVGCTLEELKDAFSFIELGNSGFSTDELRAVGCHPEKVGYGQVLPIRISCDRHDFKFNGVYFPTADQSNCLPVYKLEGRADVALYYFENGATSCWYIRKDDDDKYYIRDGSGRKLPQAHDGKEWNVYGMGFNSKLSVKVCGWDGT